MAVLDDFAAGAVAALRGTPSAFQIRGVKMFDSNFLGIKFWRLSNRVGPTPGV